MASLLREAFEGSGRKRFSMRALLGTYPKKDLQGPAREYKLTGIKNKSTKELADELAALLMEPDMIRRSFSLLTDAEIKAFEAALATGGEYVISEEREDDFATLSHLGYAFIDPERGIVHIPTETESLYRKLNTEAFRLNRRKIGWIIRCLNEIVPPYCAILPI